MNAQGSWNHKYDWSMIDRAAPPKRPAQERVADFFEIYANFDEATAQAQASRCINCGNPSCVQACPLNNRIPEWLALTAQGRFLEAAEISRSTSNMPEICSRVCPQDKLCEGACILNARTDPIAIGALERFVNEYAFAHDAVLPVQVASNGRRVAVIGSGPGGLACADQLVQLGYHVTIFESLRVPGGLLVNGIPAFKLEKSIVARRVDLLAKRGVEFRLGVRVGWDISLEALQSSYDAVFLGVGAQQTKKLDVPGAQFTGVVQALSFLVQKNVEPWLGPGDPVDVTGKRVVVLGGGDTAMDCLRTAVRSGALSATCLYRRDLANMPGSRKEYANALEEGAQFQFLVNPVELIGNEAGAVTGARCVRMELGEPDSSGRRKPRPVPNSEFLAAADMVLIAYGFDPMPFPAESDFRRVATNDWGGIVIDQNQMTSVPGVFAGGDSTRGPSLVVHAVRDARKAAVGIDRYITARKAV